MEIPAYEIFRELRRIRPTKQFLVETLFFDDGDVQLLAAHYFVENHNPRTLLYLKRYEIGDKIDVKEFLRKSKIMEDYIPNRGIDGLEEDILKYEPDRMKEAIINNMIIYIGMKQYKIAKLLFNKLVDYIGNKNKRKGEYIPRYKAEAIVSKWVEKVKR